MMASDIARCGLTKHSPLKTKLAVLAVSRRLTSSRFYPLALEAEPMITSNLIVRGTIKYMPEVTVILPAYNASRYIKTAVNCLKNQTFANFECIIVDDCSVDDTFELAHRLTTQDDRFKLHSNSQNIGQAKSRNLGLANSSGKYVIWLDVDDWFDKNLLRELFNRAETTKADVTICNTNTVLHNEGKVAVSNVMFAVIPAKTVFTLKELDNGRKLRRLAILRNELWNKLFRKDFLLKHKLCLDEELRRCDDMDFSIRALLMADRVSFINKCLVTYNSQLNNSNQSTLIEYPCSVIDSLENIFKFIIGHQLVEEYYNDFVTLLMLNSEHCYRRLNSPASIKFKECFSGLITRANIQMTDLKQLPQVYQDLFVHLSVE